MLEKNVLILIGYLKLNVAGSVYIMTSFSYIKRPGFVFGDSRSIKYLLWNFLLFLLQMLINFIYLRIIFFLLIQCLKYRFLDVKDSIS